MLEIASRFFMISLASDFMKPPYFLSFTCWTLFPCNDRREFVHLRSDLKTDVHAWCFCEFTKPLIQTLQSSKGLRDSIQRCLEVAVALCLVAKVPDLVDEFMPGLDCVKFSLRDFDLHFVIA